MKTNRCWMCGSIADSSEHIFKKRDIVRAYGNGPYTGDNSPVHVKNAKVTSFQGPNSKTIKYEKNLCHQCNTSKTQCFDIAYDTFIDWVLTNEEKALRERFINFETVYSSEYALQQLNLYKYLAKSFGCRLADANQAIPKDVVKLFKKTRFRTGLRISFSVNQDVLLMPKNIRNFYIGKGALHQTKLKSIFNNHGYMWSENVSWLFINYWYLTEPDGDLGSTWVADSKHIYLGSCEPLNDDIRKNIQDAF